jgi:hypothetical protein
MSTYRLETIRAQPGEPFAASGRIVEVLNYNPTYGHLLALVEIGEIDTALPLNFSDKAEAEPECGKETDAGTRCTRTVDQPGDRCWQHNDEDE